MPFLLELLLAKPVDDDVDADVDRGADDEEQEPHVDQLGKESLSSKKCLCTNIIED